MEGDPSNFLADYGWDAVTILQRLSADTYLVADPCRPDYPHLSAPKIGALWLRRLSDDAGPRSSGLEEVPIPVDFHIARASLATGIRLG